MAVDLYDPGPSPLMAYSSLGGGFYDPFTPVTFASYPLTTVADAVTTNLARPAILWALRESGTKYLRVTTGSTTETLALSFTALRNYYISGDLVADADGGLGGVGDYLRVLKNALNTNTGAGTYTVTLTAAWRVKIDVTGVGSYQILWADAATTLDPTRLGFLAATNPSPAATTTTSPCLPHGIWRAAKPAEKDSRDRQPIVSNVARAISGLQRTSRLAAPKKERTTAFGLLAPSRALVEYSPTTEPTGSMEYAWVNSISYGYPFRYYADDTTFAAGSAGYSMYKLRDEKDPLGEDAREGVKPNQRWRVDLSMVRHD